MKAFKKIFHKIPVSGILFFGITVCCFYLSHVILKSDHQALAKPSVKKKKQAFLKKASAKKRISQRKPTNWKADDLAMKKVQSSNILLSLKDAKIFSEKLEKLAFWNQVLSKRIRYLLNTPNKTNKKPKSQDTISINSPSHKQVNERPIVFTNELYYLRGLQIHVLTMLDNIKKESKLKESCEETRLSIEAANGFGPFEGALLPPDIDALKVLESLCGKFASPKSSL